MIDIMIDLETMGTSARAVITQIGAVQFDRYTGKLGKEFLVNISMKDCLARGREVDAGAIKFWLEGKDKCTFLNSPIPLTAGLDRLRVFCQLLKPQISGVTFPDPLLWAHATFDHPILIDAYSSQGQRPCVHYRSFRDIRTLVELAEFNYDTFKELPRKGIHHNALDDAKYQVKYCVMAFNALKERK